MEGEFLQWIYYLYRDLVTMKRNNKHSLFSIIHIVIFLSYFYIKYKYPEYIKNIPANARYFIIRIYFIFFLIIFYKRLIGFFIGDELVKKDKGE